MRPPTIIYGTAWKEEATEQLVLMALKAGFRAIDTANQRKHYHEAAVGTAIAKSGIPRKQLFLQSKFTFAFGQDHRLPYDAEANLRTQVRQSFQSSLEHLQTTYLDSYLLHGPSTDQGLSTADFEVWQELGFLHKEGKVTSLGVSNVDVEQLRLLCQKSIIKPTYVQNRCYAQLGWDQEVRKFCTENGIIYQGFSLLTANAFVLPEIKLIATRLNKTPAQVMFRFAQCIGILPLTGTNSQRHMTEDLALDFDLEGREIKFIENIIP